VTEVLLVKVSGKPIILHHLPSSFKPLSVLLVELSIACKGTVANDVAIIELYFGVLSMTGYYFIPVITHEHFY
jgi:hypothetical protein